MSDRNLANAGSVESRNFDKESVGVAAYCGVCVCCMSSRVGFSDDGLLWKHLYRSSVVSTAVLVRDVFEFCPFTAYGHRLPMKFKGIDMCPLPLLTVRTPY